MVPTKALLDRLASLFALDNAWCMDGNDDPAVMMAVVNDFTPTIGTKYEDLTFNTANVIPPAPIFPNAMAPGVDVTNGDYKIPFHMNFAGQFYSGNAVVPPLTVYGYALVKVVDESIVASVRNPFPATANEDGQIFPYPEFCFRWPPSIMR